MKCKHSAHYAYQIVLGQETGKNIVNAVINAIMLGIIQKFINRAYERGFIDSHVLHNLHQMAIRIFKS